MNSPILDFPRLKLGLKKGCSSVPLFSIFLIIAIVIFIVAVIVADLLDKVIVASVKRIGVEYVGVLGFIVRWTIYILAGLAILVQLKVAETLINTLIMSFFGTLALALGLAFGLGGKDSAAKLIEDIRRKISEK